MANYDQCPFYVDLVQSQCGCVDSASSSGFSRWPIFKGIFRMNEETGMPVAEDALIEQSRNFTRPLYSPIWQHAGGSLRSNPVLFNQLSDPVRAETLAAAFRSQRPAMSKTYPRSSSFYQNIGGNDNNPGTIMYFPVSELDNRGMLSGETANGPYFEQAVRVMAKTCCEAEGCKNYNSLFQAVRNSVLQQYNTLPPAESLASSAVKTAIDVSASIIVVFSETGNTARLVSKYRPGRAIVMLTNSGRVARQANGVYSAVHAYKVGALDDHSEELLSEVGQEAVQAGIAAVGDLMVAVHGTIHGPGMNNQVRVSMISNLTSVETASGTTISRFQSFVAAQSLDEMDKAAA